MSSREQSHFSAIISASGTARPPARRSGEPPLRGRERIAKPYASPASIAGRDRDQAHALHAAGDDQVAGAAQHRLRGEVRRLLRRAALAVDRGAGHLVGQARREPAGARDVAGLGPIVSTQPKTTSSTACGSMPYARRAP
jgi:hypothetical protein